MKKSITQIKITFVILNKFNNKKTYILHIKKASIFQPAFVYFTPYTLNLNRTISPSCIT